MSSSTFLVSIFRTLKRTNGKCKALSNNKSSSRLIKNNLKLTKHYFKKRKDGSKNIWKLVIFIR